MKKTEFIDLINKHIALCLTYYDENTDKGDEMKAQAYAGGITALVLLKKELNGERNYGEIVEKDREA